MAAADTIKDLRVEVKRCAECNARFSVDAEFCPFCGVPLSAATWDPTRDPLVGKIVDNRYEVLEPLGEGGMGTVYKVRHVTLNRQFAMKALRRDLALDAALSQRFIQEARATAAIKHPSVVSISDFGVLDDGIPYFVMELLVGETLSLRMRARGMLPPREAIGIARRIAEALAASHAANVIHRDLKPENVFLVGPSELRVVDFGAAKIVGGSKLTRPGVVFGTPYYMSPEQAGGQPVDGRADVYSLGVLLFEMLTGRVPFEADTYMGVLTKHMFAQPPKPSEAATGVQLGALEDVVMRALEKDPSARYASMKELEKALDEAERRRSSVPPGRTQPLPHVHGPAIGTARMSTAERIGRSVEQQLEREERRKRKQLFTVVVAMLVTLMLGLLVVIIVMSATTKPPTTAATSTTASSAPVAPAPVESVASSTPSTSATASATASAVPGPATATPTVAVIAKGTPAQPRWTPAPKPANPAAPATTTAKSPETAAAPPPPPPPKKTEEFADPWQK